MNRKQYLVMAGIALIAPLSTTGHATDFHVGPTYPLKRLADVSWNLLRPGDNVFIHFKPGGYHESFQLMNSGTPAKPIRVVGVNDPKTGLKPVLNGIDAIVGPSINQGYYNFLYPYGGIIITPPKGFKWGDAPSYLSIENLDICNFNQTSTMTTPSGAKKNFDRFSCGIYCERVRHLTVRNCSLHDNGNGFFCNSKYEFAALSQDLLIDHNTFLHNGNPGTFSEHHLYTEADGVVIQDNVFGPLATDSHGCAIKDRSAGTVIRNNSIIVSYLGVGVQLVGPQGGSNCIETLPNYKKSYFYGNVMVNPPLGGEAFVLYGGDGWYAQSRRGTLYAYHNTFVNKGDGTGPNHRNGALAFRLPNMTESAGAPIEETVDCRNNVFWCLAQNAGRTPTDLSLLYTGGAAHMDFGRNWLSPTVRLSTIARGGPFPPPVFSGLQNLTVDAKNNPGFTDPTGSYGIANPTSFLAMTDPSLLLATLDPYLLIPAVKPVELFKAVDIAKLKSMTDPSLYVNGVDPNMLVALLDPNVIFAAIDANLLYGIFDPNWLVPAVQPAALAGIIDPNERPGPGSSLLGAAGPLSPAIPPAYLPVTERFGMGTRLRLLRTPALGALDSAH